MSSLDAGGNAPAATHESVPRPRIQTLSDMIFGLALSIGAVSQLFQKPSGLTDIVYSIFGFGFAFLILPWYGSGKPG